MFTGGEGLWTHGDVTRVFFLSPFRIDHVEAGSAGKKGKANASGRMDLAGIGVPAKDGSKAAQSAEGGAFFSFSDVDGPT